MTASAVGNKPEGGMTPAREAAIRSAMHADERLFDFKVCAHVFVLQYSGIVSPVLVFSVLRLLVPTYVVSTRQRDRDGRCRSWRDTCCRLLPVWVQELRWPVSLNGRVSPPHGVASRVRMCW